LAYSQTKPGRNINIGEILLQIRIEELPEGGFLATSDDLPGLVAQGRTMAEAIERAQEVARKLVESYVEHADELPEVLRLGASASGNVHIPVSVS